MNHTQLTTNTGLVVHYSYLQLYTEGPVNLVLNDNFSASTENLCSKTSVKLTASKQ